MLLVKMLQTPKVELDGNEIVFPFKRVDALFYYMIVRRSATRQELIALLWENCDDATGLKNLRNTIYSLKKVLGGDFLLAPNKTTLQINPEWKLECDYYSFMNMENYELYRGEFLQGFAVKQTFSFDVWMERMRETLRQRYLMLLFCSARAAAEQGDETKAQLLASDYLREEACDENVTVFCMESYLRMHNYAKAADIYQQLREKLAEELGTAPQRHATELYLKVMNEWNQSAVPADEYVNLTSEALLAARMLSIFQGEAEYTMLVSLSRDEQMLAAGLQKLKTCGLASSRIDGTAEIWSFANRDQLEEIRHGISLTERQRLHRCAAEFMLNNTAQPSGEICSAAAMQYWLAGDKRNAAAWAIRGLDLSSERCCMPYPVSGASSALLPDFNWEDEIHHCRDLLSSAQNQMDDTEFTQLEQLLVLCRGRYALFRCDREEGYTLVGSLTGNSSARDATILMRSCILLSEECMCRQNTVVGERYVAAGEHIAARMEDKIWAAIFLRLRGQCFYLRGESDKAMYYLSEAKDVLEVLPHRDEVRLQLAGIREVQGCIMSARGDYAGASHKLRMALDAMDKENHVEEVWISVNYGRTAFHLEDYKRAFDLFKRAYEASEATGSIWGKGASGAYLAWYSARNECYETASQQIVTAQKNAEQTGSPLEKGIVCYISMLLRARLDAEQRHSNQLAKTLRLPAEEYARRGVHYMGNLPECFESAELSRGLRDGIRKSRSLSEKELYSKERHFMAE